MKARLLIPGPDFDANWPRAAKLLQRAVDASHGEMLVEDIPELVYNSSMFVGAVFNEREDLVLALVGEVLLYPRKKILNVVYVGGKPMAQTNATHLYPVLEDIAKFLGCSMIQGICGPASTRLYTRMMGLKPVYTVLRKEVGP